MSLVFQSALEIRSIILNSHLNSSISSSLEICIQSFDLIGKLRNVKRYGTVRATTMVGNNGPEDNSALTFHETNEKEKPEIRTLLQEEVNERTNQELHRAIYKTARGFDSTCPRIIGHIASESLPNGRY